MAVGKYKYKGIGSDGRKVEGEIDGRDIKEVKRTLRRRGIRVRKLVAPSILDVDLQKNFGIKLSSSLLYLFL